MKWPWSRDKSPDPEVGWEAVREWRGSYLAAVVHIVGWQHADGRRKIEVVTRAVWVREDYSHRLKAYADAQAWVRFLDVPRKPVHPRIDA